MDNRDIVPYAPVPLLENGCHVNSELVNSVKACKYMYKYMCVYAPNTSTRVQLYTYLATPIHNICTQPRIIYGSLPLRLPLGAAGLKPAVHLFPIASDCFPFFSGGGGRWAGPP